MKPEYTDEAFILVVLKDGTRIARPLGAFGGTAFVTSTLASEGYDLSGATIQTVRHRWWARMVEPGTIVVTPWEGPFRIKVEAEEKFEGRE